MHIFPVQFHLGPIPTNLLGGSHAIPQTFSGSAVLFLLSLCYA
jgi:hypothetical protein